MKWQESRWENCGYCDVEIRLECGLTEAVKYIVRENEGETSNMEQCVSIVVARG